MILLLVIAAWIFLLTLVVGLCAAARIGDLAQLVSTAAEWNRAVENRPWEPLEHMADASLLHSDGVAA